MSLSRVTTIFSKASSCEFTVTFHEGDGVAEICKTTYINKEDGSIESDCQKIVFKKGMLTLSEAEELADSFAESLQAIYGPDGDRIGENRESFIDDEDDL